ncbi:MAG: hypothetical protein QXI19_09280 [Candidatus Caldarchaeum sp.]
MNFRIEPFTVEISHGADGGVTARHTPDRVVYWGLYLDDKPIMRSSSRELTEDAKNWMEKWLRAA